jgi:LmbE family N-acetylglucosaminyl deacetylase
MQERGIKLPWEPEVKEGAAAEEPSLEEQAEEFGVPEADITTIVDVADYADAKRAAMDCHKTQRQDMGWLLDLPPDLQAEAISPEHFILTRWRDHEVPAGYREISVFDGL